MSKLSAKKRKEADDVFDRWRASLADRDRTHGNLLENFGDLFYDLGRLSLPYEIGKEYLTQAYRAHLPNSSTIKATFKRMKKEGRFDDLDEFKKAWFRMIKDKATNAFHEYFDIPFEDGKTEAEIKRDKKLKQRSANISDYISNYEQIDLAELRKQAAEAKKADSENLNQEDLINNLGAN